MGKLNVEELSFEEALAKLEELVEKIDTGDLALAEALETFKLATELSEHCARLLKEAEAAVEELAADSDAADAAAGGEDEDDVDPFGDR